MSAPLNAAAHAAAVLREAECLHDAASVRAAYQRLADAVTTDYRQRNPLLLCVMTGGLQTTAELSQRLDFALEIDYLHASRYRGALQGGGLHWVRQPNAERVRDRHVLIVDDILDEGHTLVAIRQALLALSPASLAVAVLAQKQHDRCAAEASAEYVGLTVADRYVFGCGMDYKEYWRQLPAIYAVRDA